MKRDALGEYQRKRDFAKTPEPKGSKRKAARKPIFVVQKHAASRLHYDFRLEVGGVLKSWAVPKGPSTNPRDKRLAMLVEDHPLDYAGFEGMIPEGEYGGGTVIVWDTGSYRNVTERDGNTIPAAEALAQGHFRMELSGKKLKGGYAITRVARDPGGRERWILVKRRDEWADESREIVAAEPRSALSGRTIEEVAEQG